MQTARPRVLLVGVIPEVAAALHAALAHEADVVQVSAADAVAHVGDTGDGRRPALVVIGRELPAPLGLVHALRPDGVERGVIVVAAPETEDTLATLPLMFSTDQVRQVPPTPLGRLPAAARQLLEDMARQRHYTAVRAAAQRQLAAGAAISHQVGEQLFGEFLTQAPVGAIMLDDSGGMTAWNHKAADILGLTEPDSLGRALTALFPVSVQERLRQHLAQAFDADAVFERDRPSAANQALRLAPQLVSDARGAERVLVLVEDVTDRVQVQRELAERTSHALLSGDVAAAMTAGGPLSDRLQKAAQAIVDRLDVALARVWTLDPARNMLDLAAGAGLYTHLDGKHATIPAGALEVESIAAERVAHLTNAVIGDPRIHDQEWARREGMVAFAGYPLIADGELMGALGLFARHPLPATSLDALASIADQIAVGVRGERLLQRLSTIAETLQRSLLPSALPELSRLALAARYLPAAEGVQAGGDWYDVLDLDDDHVALVVGDVVGHGAPAAAVMGQLRSALAAYLLEGRAPAQALERLNHFAARVAGAQASTATVLILHTGTGELRWASAGHPPPLVVDPDGQPRYLLEDGRGPCLAVSRDLPFRQASTHLSPGSCVLLYTDGLIERRDADIDTGLDHLAALAADLYRNSPDEFAEQLLEQLLAVRGVADDVALVITRLLPPPLRLVAPALATELTAIRRQVAMWAVQARLPEELTDDMVQCVDEAAANCVEHAYPHGGGEMQVELSTGSDGAINARVTDFGSWRPPSAEKGYRGHGLGLIDKLSERMHIDPTPHGTTVRVRFNAAPRSVRAGCRHRGFGSATLVAERGWEPREPGV